jgi:hypothetical protein
MESSPGCWSYYCEVLEREYRDRAFFEDECIHKLTVDAYAVQHPGKPSQQSVRSVGYHLIRLCLILEKEIAPARTQDLMVTITKKKQVFWWLTPPSSMGTQTILDVFNARDLTEHKTEVKRWARSVWSAWEIHHDVIRSWLPIA